MLLPRDLTYLVKDATRPLDWTNFEKSVERVQEKAAVILDSKDV
jgi:hypothetical protein